MIQQAALLQNLGYTMSLARTRAKHLKIGIRSSFLGGNCDEYHLLRILQLRIAKFFSLL
jgi:hypothetical protein